MSLRRWYARRSSSSVVQASTSGSPKLQSFASDRLIEPQGAAPASDRVTGVQLGGDEVAFSLDGRKLSFPDPLRVSPSAPLRIALATTA